MNDKNDKKDCIVINYTGHSGAGPLDAFAMAKALQDSGECIVPIISSSVENISAWKNAGLEKIIIIDTYSSKISLIINSILFSVKHRKHITNELNNYHIKAIYCPMVTFWTAKINRLIKCNKIIMVNHDPIPHTGQSILEPTRLFNPFKHANIVIVHSRTFIEFASQKYAHVEYFPLGEHSFYKDIENKKTIIEYDSSKVNFVFFGRIEKYKGIDTLINAYKLLCQKYNGTISLSIIGNGDFMQYSNMLSDLNNITIINRWIRDEEVESVFLGKNLINVCPYKDATQSGSVLVAYDYGVPVIATKTGGLLEQVFDGKTGFLVSPDSPEELATAMEKYINDINIINSQQKNIKKYLDSISWDSSAQKLVSLIEKIKE